MQIAGRGVRRRPYHAPATAPGSQPRLGLTSLNYFIALMLKVEAINSGGFAGPLLILLNLTMVLALVASVLFGAVKMEASVARGDEKKKMEIELIGSGVSAAGDPDRARGWSEFDGAQNMHSDVRNPVALAEQGDSGFRRAGLMPKKHTAGGDDDDIPPEQEPRPMPRHHLSVQEPAKSTI
jgi:hypothetical protein